MSSFYEFRMLNLPKRYKLSQHAVAMIKAHEDMMTCVIDEAELGRRIRLSLENRSSMLETMVKCADIMGTQPEESKYCLAIIKICADIVRIADKPPAADGFPNFLKLPEELRQRVYGYYFSSSPDNVVIPFGKKGNCGCAPHGCIRWCQRNLSLAFTSKQMSGEVLPYFYANNIVHFSCACEIGARLRNSITLRKYIRKVKFHWCGPLADTGISALLACQLDELIIVISMATSKEPSERERELSRFFIRHNGRGKAGLGIQDCLGFDELSAIRGVKSVHVMNCDKSLAPPRSSEDKNCLLSWLNAKVKEPREDEEDEEE